MTRRQTRRVLSIGVVLTLGGIGYLLGRALSGREAPLPRPSAPAGQAASQEIEGFRRVKVKDGKKVWELMAREARYFDDQGVVLVVEPELSFFSEDGSGGRLRGREGRVRLEGNDVKEIDLSGGIHVETGEWTLDTEQAVYREGAHAIAAPGDVTISSQDGSSLRGHGMVVALSDQKVVLLADVKTLILPKAGGALGPTAPPAPRAPKPAPARSTGASTGASTRASTARSPLAAAQPDGAR